MLKGDLTATSLASVLLDLGESAATGSLIVNHLDGDEAQIFLRSGLVCGISASNQRSDLGAKLVSSGVLAPEALSDALEAQRTDLSAWNLGELLVHLGYVEEEVIQQFVAEQLHEALWDLLRLTEGRWKFRKNAKIREDIRPPHAVVELLETLRERGYEWEEISSVVDSPNAVPVLSARGDGAPETTLDSDAWSMLCKIDGVRSVAELANDCGYTLFEAGQVLVTLVDAGLVDITDDVDYEAEDVYGAGALANALIGSGAFGARSAPATQNGAADTGESALSRLARLASDVTSRGVAATATTNPLQLDVMAAQLSGSSNLTVPIRRNGESFAASMGRVSGALADVLGPAPEDTDEVTSLIEVRKRPRAPRTPDYTGGEQELERRRRLRAAAAAELAAAQEAAESLRPDRVLDGPPDADDPPKLVDLEAERARVAARDAEEAERYATEGAARRAAERFAKAAAEQAARLAAETSDTDSVERAAEEASLLAAEQAEREAAEEAARAAAEEAERLAAEEAVREAAELAEREAAAQAAREAAEQAARAAAEEAARVAAEEAARLAAEQAAREAAEQAAQAAAEQAERLAAEQAAREALERAEREAAEQEAREAAEQEAREAAEQAAREAAELAAREAAEEAARLAAEQAEREAAEREAVEQAALAAAQAQAAAAEQAQRLAEEQAALAAQAAAVEAARIEAEELAAAALRADQAAAASAMLSELQYTASESAAEPVIAEVVEPEPEVEPDPEPEPVRAGETDTAALLRELSSLGVEDGERPSLASAVPRAPRPSHPDPKKAKKKIGLFGL